MNAMKSENRTRMMIAAAALAVLLTALAVVSAFFAPERFFQSYLFSYLFWIDLPLGALPLLMIYRLTGGAWGSTLRKILEASADTLWLFVILSLPILIWIGKLYPWMKPEVASDPKVLHKHAYLNAASFIARTVVYFAAWLLLNSSLQRLSLRHEERPSPETDAKLRNLSAGGLVVLGLTISFASFDWQMSVEPKWYSTIYGMVYGVGQSLQSYAFALVCFGILAAKSLRENRFSNKVLWDAGNILLTLVILWTYVSFMQYLIIWSGNLPHEVTWFNNRIHGGWQVPVLLLSIFQFGAPFFILLFRRSKQAPRKLLLIGLGVFTIRIVDHYWMLMPGFYPERLTPLWQAAVLWLAMGTLWIALFALRLSKRPWFAESDPDWSLALLTAEEAKARG